MATLMIGNIANSCDKVRKGQYWHRLHLGEQKLFMPACRDRGFRTGPKPEGGRETNQGQLSKFSLAIGSMSTRWHEQKRG